MVRKRGKGWFNEPLRHSLARKGVKTGRKGYVRKPRTIKISSVEKQVTTKYASPEGFEFSFEPVEDSLTVIETDKGYEARYLVQDENPDSPKDWFDDNVFLVNYHRDFWIEHEEIKPSDLETYYIQGGKIPQEKDYWIFPIDSYIHGGVQLDFAGGFRGRLPQGHERFDVSHVGAVLVSKKEFKTKKQAKKIAEGRVKDWNLYLGGEVYGIVKETYDKKKKLVDTESTFGYYGYEDAKKELRTL